MGGASDILVSVKDERVVFMRKQKAEVRRKLRVLCGGEREGVQGGARLVQEYLERCVVQLVAYGGGVKDKCMVGANRSSCGKGD